jgi:Flp pilus assembly pilin Flp
VQGARARSALPARRPRRTRVTRTPITSYEVEMQLALSIFHRFRRRDEGQDLLEYGLLAALIAVVALGATQAVGNTILNVFWSAIAAANV